MGGRGAMLIWCLMLLIMVRLKYLAASLSYSTVLPKNYVLFYVKINYVQRATETIWNDLSC